MLILGSEREVKNVQKKKLGRPTDSPKRHEIKVRLDDAALETLDGYCKRKEITRVQGIRDGINSLKDK